MTGSHSTPRSFTVEQGGRTLRRNLRHLHPSKEPLPASAFKTGNWEGTTTAPATEEPLSSPRADSDVPSEPAKDDAYITSTGRTVRRFAGYKDYVYDIMTHYLS